MSDVINDAGMQLLKHPWETSNRVTYWAFNKLTSSDGLKEIWQGTLNTVTGIPDRIENSGTNLYTAYVGTWWPFNTRASETMHELNTLYGRNMTDPMAELGGVQALLSGTEVFPMAKGAAWGYKAAAPAVEKAASAITGKQALAGELSSLGKQAQAASPQVAKTVSQKETLLRIDCSFRGDMQVRTDKGFLPIADIRSGDRVWARNEISGLMGYRPVLNTINSTDPDTAYLVVEDKDGKRQTIVSDSRHPYFAQYGDDPTPPAPSAGKPYHGDIKNAYWVNAADLEAGHKLLDDHNHWQTVVSVTVKKEPLNSYNLEVDNDHTYFIRGLQGERGIWVHNKNCLYSLTEEQRATHRTIDNHVVYTVQEGGKTSYYIDNPAKAVTGTGPNYVEVRVEGKKVTVLNENKPDIIRWDSQSRYYEAHSGHKGSWNSALNTPEKGASYTVHSGKSTFNYRTDSLGRVEMAEGNLSLRATGTNGKSQNTYYRNRNQQSCAGNCYRAKDDHGGHLFAIMFDGPGEGINIVAMNGKLNGYGGAWYNMEMKWKDILENGGSVHVKIEPVYSKGSKRPDGFKITETINGQASEPNIIMNTPTGK